MLPPVSWHVHIVSGPSEFSVHDPIQSNNQQHAPMPVAPGLFYSTDNYNSPDPKQWFVNDRDESIQPDFWLVTTAIELKMIAWVLEQRGIIRP